ncbi:hypothetical protein N7507_004135 [Penicillium longicatenatum]|nr:hypothetical protein N7507_004135 [Penicillium longicatenatum]
MEPEISDPVDWSVDEVVNFLCSPGPAPWAQSLKAPRSDPVVLGTALRDNEICGEVLMHVDNDGLKDMGVKAYGHRIMLMKAIQWLQQKSLKYNLSRKDVPIEVALSRTSSPYPHEGTPMSAVLNPNSADLISSPIGNLAIQTTLKLKRRIAPTLLQGEASPMLAPRTLLDGFLSPSHANSLPQDVCLNIANTPSDHTALYGNKNDSSENNVKIPPRTENEEKFLSYLLVKYGPQDDDAGLPKYGESGSEGEYDRETWQEIVDDNPDLEDEHPDLEESRLSGLSQEECDKILAEYITEQEESWRQKALPRNLPRAEGLWLSFRENSTLQEEKLRRSNRIEHLQDRLRKFQQAIMNVAYKSPSAFRRACGAMDMTIFDRCTEKWTLGILELDTCPEPALRPAKVPRPCKKRDIESVSAEEEEDDTLTSDAESFYEGLVEEDEGDIEPSANENQPELGSPMCVSLGDEDTEVPSRTPRSEVAHRMPFTLESSPTSSFSLSPNPPTKRRRVSDPGRRGHVNAKLNFRGPFLQDDDGDMELTDITNVADESRTAPLQQDNAAEDIIKTPPLNPTVLPVDIDGTNSSLKLTPLRKEHATKDMINTLPSPTQPIKLKISQPRDRTIEIEQPLPSPNDGTAPVLLDRAREPTQPQPILTAFQEDMAVDTDEADVLRMVEGMTMASIEAKKDRIQLLAKIVMQLPSSEYRGFPDYLDRWFPPIYREKIQEVIRAMMNNQRKLDGVDPPESKLSMRLGALFVSWYHCASVSSAGLQPKRLQEALDAIEGDYDEEASLTTVFINKLQSLINTYNALRPESSRRRSLDEGSRKEDVLSPPSQLSKPNLKRKKQYVPKAPNAVQKNAQERKAVQDRAREEFRKEREHKGLSNSDRAGQAVTFKDPIIYLNPALGEFVKPHQVIGIQFMWRELCDSENSQGCLLAHVMGLGKTFQVISLLVTIAEAAASKNPKIKAQVPERFHQSRTLVICPSFLVPNWIKEFHCWVPSSHYLGNIFQIMATPNIDPADRTATIQTWGEEGGVIIMSYEMFRKFINNDGNRFNGQEHKMILDALLNKPNIVIADEAHKLKGEKTSISQVTSRFRTKSRIAMTGSPLANNLFEYYQMIEWVAPGYLETVQSFKEKFMEPIQEGLYIDSNRHQRRASLVALKVLNGILEPKIQRAGHSVIAFDLPPKTELVVRITLSEIQRMAYNIFVEELQASHNHSRLWQWLAIGQLCCNHPKPFLEKLENRTATSGQGVEASVLDGDADLPPNLLPRIKALLAPVPDILDSNLSHRSLLLDRILDESKRIGDKVLVFSQSIPTLNYLDRLFSQGNRNYSRIDGSTDAGKRQGIVNQFNEDPTLEILLISTRAGGLGLNIHGANRVVIFDFLFNPSWEDQAIGRAYRLGQTKPVFVYRFVAAGTFEEIIFNLTLFKSQLTVRVVDQKNVLREGHKNSTKYLFPVKAGKKKSIDHIRGKDPEVLDKIIANGDLADSILEITLSKAQDDENDQLSTEENLRVKDELGLEQLKRSDPAAFRAEMKKRQLAEHAKAEAARLEQAKAEAARAEMQAHFKEQQREQQQQQQKEQQEKKQQHSSPQNPQQQSRQQPIPQQQPANPSLFRQVGTPQAAAPSAFGQSPGTKSFGQPTQNQSSGQTQQANPNPSCQPLTPSEMQRRLHQHGSGPMPHQGFAQLPPRPPAPNPGPPYPWVPTNNWLPSLIAQGPGQGANLPPTLHAPTRPSSTPAMENVPVNPWRASPQERISRNQSQPATSTFAPKHSQSGVMNARNSAMKHAFSCDKDGNWVSTRQFPIPPASTQPQTTSAQGNSGPSASPSFDLSVPEGDHRPPTQTGPRQ